jgi:ribose transport system substrate-binding protein
MLAATIGMGLLLGCNSQNESATPASEGRLFGVSFQTMNNPFFVDLNAGIKEVIEAHGDRLVTLDAQFNSLKQKNDVSDMVLQRASGIFINPVNWEGIRGSLLQAQRKEIPCIVVDAPAKDVELALCTVASDNIEAGRMAGQALAEVKPNAKVVILHLSTNKACIDRVTGFQEELAKHPGMEILDIQEGKGTTEGARPVMRDLLGRFPELDAVFPINDPSALGAISALESTGKLADVTVVTVDGSQEAIKAVQAGKLLSTSAQFPKEIGLKSAEIMYAHLEGKPVEKDVKIRVELITKSNADSFLRAE